MTRFIEPLRQNNGLQEVERLYIYMFMVNMSLSHVTSLALVSHSNMSSKVDRYLNVLITFITSVLKFIIMLVYVVFQSSTGLELHLTCIGKYI